jgi:hypothetical protein
MLEQDDRPTVNADQMGQYSGGGGGAGDYRPTVASTGAGGLGGLYGEQEPSVAETVVLRSKKKQPLAWLVRKEGPRAGQVFRLDAEGSAVGRDAQCDIILDDDAISRWHAKLKYEEVEEGSKDMAFFIYDMASENGTYVNGDKVYRSILKDNDEVMVGRTILVYKRVDVSTKG